MNDGPLDVVGIGNAIVDVLSHADDEFLARENLVKGSMALIDTSRAESLYDTMGPAIEVSGGSAANTIAGLASFGGKGGFVGRVRDDQLGNVFSHDLLELGVEFDVAPATDGPPTGRCLILVTPDAQRTLNTFLGAGADLGPNDVDESLISRAQITYLEGYLWDPLAAKEAFRKASKVAHTAGRKIAFSLSDSFCVDRWRQEFIYLAENEIDILFANEDEIMALYQVKSFEEALQHVSRHCEIAALTRSEKGSVIVSGDDVHIIDTEPTSCVVDTTGAGDLYAAGFLYGLSRDRDLQTCGRLGSIAASEVISHMGARPESSLKQLSRERLGETA
jgi:sugar/nucleoside kinase (ribokinase family)